MPDDLITSGATGGVAGLMVAFLKDAYTQYKNDKKDEDIARKFRDIEETMAAIKLDLAKNYPSNMDMQRLSDAIKQDHKAILDRVDRIQTSFSELSGFLAERLKH
jgi:hypothetical protein